MRWKVSEAKQRFSEVVKEASAEPQLIYRRDRLVAAVIDAPTLREFEDWRRRHRGASFGERMAELRAIAGEEGWALEVPERADRPNPFAADLDDLPR